MDPAGPVGLLAGRYELISRIGSGGMGVVHRAFDRKLNRIVAVKLLRPDVVAQTNAALFLGEMKILSQLSHPGVVRFLDADEHGSEFLYVMELLNGHTWADQPPDRSTLYALLDQLLDALAYVHSEGIIHRDIKPSNVFLDATRGPMLVDFGIARRIVSLPTQNITLVGTPRYFAPELLLGAAPSVQSDLFALAFMALETLLETNLHHVAADKPLTSPDQVFSSLCSAAYYATAKRLIPSNDPLAAHLLWSISPDPVDRPETASALRQALAKAKQSIGYRQDETTIKPTAAAVYSPRRWRTRWTFVSAMALALAFLALERKGTRLPWLPAIRGASPLSPTDVVDWGHLERLQEHIRAGNNMEQALLGQPLPWARRLHEQLGAAQVRVNQAIDGLQALQTRILRVDSGPTPHVPTGFRFAVVALVARAHMSLAHLEQLSALSARGEIAGHPGRSELLRTIASGGPGPRAISALDGLFREIRNSLTASDFPMAFCLNYTRIAGNSVTFPADSLDETAEWTRPIFTFEKELQTEGMDERAVRGRLFLMSWRFGSQSKWLGTNSRVLEWLSDLRAMMVRRPAEATELGAIAQEFALFSANQLVVKTYQRQDRLPDPGLLQGPLSSSRGAPWSVALEAREEAQDLEFLDRLLEHCNHLSSKQDQRALELWVIERCLSVRCLLAIRLHRLLGNGSGPRSQAVEDLEKKFRQYAAALHQSVQEVDRSASQDPLLFWMWMCDIRQLALAVQAGKGQTEVERCKAIIDAGLSDPAGVPDSSAGVWTELLRTQWDQVFHSPGAGGNPSATLARAMAAGRLSLRFPNANGLCEILEESSATFLKHVAPGLIERERRRLAGLALESHPLPGAELRIEAPVAADLERLGKLLQSLNSSTRSPSFKLTAARARLLACFANLQVLWLQNLQSLSSERVFGQLLSRERIVKLAWKLGRTGAGCDMVQFALRATLEALRVLAQTDSIPNDGQAETFLEVHATASSVRELMPGETCVDALRSAWTEFETVSRLDPEKGRLMRAFWEYGLQSTSGNYEIVYETLRKMRVRHPLLADTLLPRLSRPR